MVAKTDTNIEVTTVNKPTSDQTYSNITADSDFDSTQDGMQKVSQGAYRIAGNAESYTLEPITGVTNANGVIDLANKGESVFYVSDSVGSFDLRFGYSWGGRNNSLLYTRSEDETLKAVEIVQPQPVQPQPVQPQPVQPQPVQPQPVQPQPVQPQPVEPPPVEPPPVEPPPVEPPLVAPPPQSQLTPGTIDYFNNAASRHVGDTGSTVPQDPHDVIVHRARSTFPGEDGKAGAYYVDAYGKTRSAEAADGRMDRNDQIIAGNAAARAASRSEQPNPLQRYEDMDAQTRALTGIVGEREQTQASRVWQKRVETENRTRVSRGGEVMSADEELALANRYYSVPVADRTSTIRADSDEASRGVNLTPEQKEELRVEEKREKQERADEGRVDMLREHWVDEARRDQVADGVAEIFQAEKDTRLQLEEAEAEVAAFYWTNGNDQLEEKRDPAVPDDVARTARIAADELEAKRTEARVAHEKAVKDATDMRDLVDAFQADDPASVRRLAKETGVPVPQDARQPMQAFSTIGEYAKKVSGAAEWITEMGSKPFEFAKSLTDYTERHYTEQAAAATALTAQFATDREAAHARIAKMQEAHRQYFQTLMTSIQQRRDPLFHDGIKAGAAAMSAELGKQAVKAGDDKEARSNYDVDQENWEEKQRQDKLKALKDREKAALA